MTEWSRFNERLTMPNGIATIEGIPGISIESSASDIFNAINQNIPPMVANQLFVVHNNLLYPLADFLNFIAQIVDPEIKENILRLRIAPYSTVSSFRLANTSRDWLQLQDFLSQPDLSLLFEKIVEVFSGITDVTNLTEFDQTINQAFREVSQLVNATRERFMQSSGLIQPQ